MSQGFSEVGCRRCGKGLWRVLTDGQGHFRSRCAACGYVADVPPKEVKDEPDVKAYGMRFFT